MRLTLPGAREARIKAATWHLGASVLVAIAAAALVFGLWYPYPYRELSGGKELFGILVSVDVILGPLITLVIFNTDKPRPELIRDMALILTLQLCALCFGLWTVFQARPVHLVFEEDRFRVVDAVEVPRTMLDRVPAGIEALPLRGPTVLAIRPFIDLKEKADDTFAALQGLQLGARPDLWMDYAQASARVFYASRAIDDLKKRFPAQRAQIEAAVAATGLGDEGLRYLPLAARKLFWTVLIDARTAEVRGFIDLDSF